MRHQILSNLQYVTSFFFYIFSYMMLFFRTLAKFTKIYCLFETSLVHTYYFLKVKDMIFFGSASIIFLYYNHHWLDWCVDGRGDTLLHGSFVHSAFIIAHYNALIAQKGCHLGSSQAKAKIIMQGST